jgi:hypothetical protein
VGGGGRRPPGAATGALDLVGVEWNKDGWCLVDCERERAKRAQKKEPPAFHIVLSAGPPLGHFLFMGWATHAEVLTSPVEDFGRGDCYVCRDLHPRLQIFTCKRGTGWCG